MEKNNIGTKIEEKTINKIVEKKLETKIEENPVKKTGEKKEIKKLNDYKEKKIEGKKDPESDMDKKKGREKVKEKLKVKKEFAIANGSSLHISKKQGMYICSFIKSKNIGQAIKELEEVKTYKRIIPFKGEIPHKKGKGMMSGRYPIKAVGMFINLLKALKGNSIVNGLDLEKTVISCASANWAARPARKGNRRGKRTNVILESRETVNSKKVFKNSNEKLIQGGNK